MGLRCDDRTVLVRYLLSDTTSLLGNSVVMVLLPLVVYARTGSGAAMGVVFTVTTVAAVVISSIGGWVTDRFDRRRLSAAADALSAASVAGLPIVDAAWGLDLGWFIALGVIGALGDVPGMTAREALGPTLAQRTGMPVERLVALRESLGALVLIVGPGLAAVLLWRVEPVTAFWVAAGTSTLAALTTMTLPGEAGRYERDDTISARNAVGASLAGFSLIWRDPTLRRLIALSTLAVAVVGTLQSFVLPVHLADEGRAPHLGTVFIVLASGTIVGGLVHAALSARFSPATWFRVGLVVVLGGVAGLALLPDLGLLLVASFVVGLGAAPTNAVAATAVVQRVSEGVRGRVIGAQNVLMMGALPISLVPAALVADRWGLGTTGRALAAVWLVTTLWAITTRSMQWPAHPAAHDQVADDQVADDQVADDLAAEDLAAGGVAAECLASSIGPAVEAPAVARPGVEEAR